jgi:predicted RND superfamily exporter protein
MWIKIAGLVLRNRILILIIIALSTAFMAYEGKDVKMSYHYAKLLPETDTAYIQHQEFKAKYGEEANIFVAGFQDSTFFEKDKINDLIKLTNSLKNVYGVSSVISLTDLIRLEKDTANKMFIAKNIFPKQITSQKELDSLKGIENQYPLYKGVFFNDTSNVYLFSISIDKEVLNDVDRVAVVDTIKLLINNFSDKHSIDSKLSGLPYIRTEVSKKIKSELNMFIIFSALISMIILYIFFRSFKVVLFSMIVVGITVVWVMGTMGLFNFEITILTGMIPPLLIVIGIPNSIFLLNKFFAEYKEHGNIIKSIQRVIQKTGSAIFLTNLTTAAGFATFITTNSEVLQEFGIIATINIFVLFILSLTIIPIAYSYLPKPKEKHIQHLDAKFLMKFVDYLIYTTKTKRNQVFAVTILVIVVGIIGVFQIKTTGYMVDDIPENDPIYKDLKFFEHNFKGLLPLEILIDTKKKKGAYKLSTLKKVDKLQKRLSEYDELSKTISVVDGIKFAKQSFYNGQEKYFKLPSSSEKNWIFNYLRKSKGENTKFMSSFVDSTAQELRISAKVADVGTQKMVILVDKISADVDSIFPPDKFDNVITGISVVFFRGTKYLIKNLFLSLSLAIVLIAIFMALMFSSVRMVFISLVPNLLPLLLTAGMMGYFGIPIKPSTILVFSIAFGISVDDTIHYLAKYRQELIATNWDIKKSVIAALKETGISMIYTSIVLFFGFGVFITSSFGGTKALGILVSFTLLAAMLANLWLLPSLLLRLEKRITTKAFKEPLLHIFDEEEDIELDDLKIESTTKKDE